MKAVTNTIKSISRKTARKNPLSSYAYFSNKNDSKFILLCAFVEVLPKFCTFQGVRRLFLSVLRFLLSDHLLYRPPLSFPGILPWSKWRIFQDRLLFSEVILKKEGVKLSLCRSTVWVWLIRTRLIRSFTQFELSFKFWQDSQYFMFKMHC